MKTHLSKHRLRNLSRIRSLSSFEEYIFLVLYHKQGKQILVRLTPKTTKNTIKATETGMAMSSSKQVIMVVSWKQPAYTASTESECYSARDDLMASQVATRTRTHAAFHGSEAIQFETPRRKWHRQEKISRNALRTWPWPFQIEIQTTIILL